MGICGVHHVAMIVSDYKKSREFYVDKLGFEIVRENFREDRQDYKLDLALNGVELEIFAPAKADEGHKLHPERASFPEAYGLRQAGLLWQRHWLLARLMQASKGNG